MDLKLSSGQIQWVLAGFFVAADLGSLASGYLARRLPISGFSVEQQYVPALFFCRVLYFVRRLAREDRQQRNDVGEAFVKRGLVRG